MKRINEKFSVSTDVKQVADNFLTKIDILTQHYNTDKSFKHSFFGMDFQIKFKCVKSGEQFAFASTDLIAKDMEIYYDGKNEGELKDSLYHEILHIYQYEKNKRLYQNDKNYKIASFIIYQFNTRNINAIQNIRLRDIDYLFANALYASFSFEQDAMIHGLYAKIQKFPYIYALQYLKNTDEYMYIKDMENALHIIEKYPGSFNEKLFQISVENYKDLIKKQLRRFRTKLDNMMNLIRSNKELNERHMFIPHFRPSQKGHI